MVLVDYIGIFFDFYCFDDIAGERMIISKNDLVHHILCFSIICSLFQYFFLYLLFCATSDDFSSKPRISVHDLNTTNKN
jgi:hypothetical protein